MLSVLRILNTYVDPVTLVVLAPVFCMCLSLWHVYVLRRLTPGILRALLALPWVLPVMVICRGKHHIVYTLANFFISLAVSKVLAGALNRGPLKREWTLWQVYAIVALPIAIQSPEQAVTSTAVLSAGRSAGRLRAKQRPTPVATVKDVQKLFASTVKAGGFMAISGMLELPLPLFVKHLLMVLSLYCVLGGLMDLFSTIAGVSYCMATKPGFDKPWMATSVADFWRRRWNAVVAYSLRWLIYDPLVEGSLVHKDGSAMTHRGLSLQGTSEGMLSRRSVAMAATFLISGLLHDMMYYISNGITSRQWRWTAFFVVQAPLIWLERLLDTALLRLGASDFVHKLVTHAYAIGALAATAHVLFFPACVDAPHTCHVLTYSQMQE